jgi:type IV pilus assembly protein PilC
MEPLGLALPLIGPIMRYNLLARWTDAVGVGVHAGLDLPRAVELADDAVASPALSHDGSLIIANLNAGKSLDDVHNTRLLPATVLAAISLASKNNDLPTALTTLSEMYQEQARLRTSLLPGLLTPILLILVAVVIGMIVLAMFLPLITLIQNITGPSK